MSLRFAAGLLHCCLLLEPSLAVGGEAPATKEKPAPCTDRYGDPLPEGAIARLGTERFRHDSQVTSIAYSPDGRLLATGGFDHTVRLWQASTGKELFRFTLPRSRYSLAPEVAFCRGGKSLCALHTGSPALHFWDVATGKEQPGLDVLNNERIFRVVFSADGLTLAAICWLPQGIENRLRLCRLDTGKEIMGFVSPRERSLFVAFAPDGKTMAISHEGAICLYDTASGRKLHTLPTHKGQFARLAFSAQGILACASFGEKVIRLWDPVAKSEKHVLRGHTEHITSLAFSADGKRLVSASVNDFTFRVWDVARGEAIWTHHARPGGANAVLLSPDGKTVAEGSVNLIYALQLWDVATRQETVLTEGQLVPVREVGFTPDGSVVTSGAGGWEDNGIRLWSARDGRPLAQLQEKTGRFNQSAVSPDGRTAALAKVDGTVCLWDVPSGKETQRWISDAGYVSSLSFAPDGKTLAIAHYRSHEPLTRTLVLRQVASGKKVRQWQLAGLTVPFVLFSPNGKHIVSLCGDMQLWDVAEGKELRQFRYPSKKERPILSPCLAPDGSVLAAVCYPRGVGVWDVASGDFIAHLDNKGQAAGSLTFSPDSRLLACGGGDGVIEFWDTLTWTLAGKWQGPESPVCALAFSADGRLLASGYQNTTALIWDVPSLWTTPKPQDGWTKERLDALWTHLGSRETKNAYQAIALLRQAPAEALPLLRKHVRPARAGDTPSVARLIADLDSEDFKVREKATQELAARGSAAHAALRAAMAGNPTAEAKRRMQGILEKMPSQTPHKLMTADERRNLRAIAVLEQIGTDEARRLLADLAKGADDALLTRAARDARLRLERRNGSP